MSVCGRESSSTTITICILLAIALTWSIGYSIQAIGKNPIDFTYDFEYEINSEKEQYRVELCKLFTKIVRVAPQTCLQFIVEAVASQLNILNTT
jgi:hypothetical protein